MKLSQVGEFGLIEILRKTEQKKTRKDTVIGIGDDCAVVKLPTDKRQLPNKSKSLKHQKYLLITTDALIENIHFKIDGKNGRNRGFSRRRGPFFHLGQKALLASISDIAAMGGIPTHALVTIGLPNRMRVEQVKEIYRGINNLARKHRIDIIGGDTVSSPKGLIISVTLLGEVEKDKLLLRSGAGGGDIICVTGEFGGPAANRFRIPHSPFRIRLKESGIIAKMKLASAMIDSSDGLVRSVIEVCKASKAGAMIWTDKVPVAKGATLAQALYGGEEYELVFTVPRRNVARLKGLKFPIRAVGEIAPRRQGVQLVDQRGKISKLKAGGFEHFK